MSRILTPQQKIERSIVTDFRRDIWNKFVMGYERQEDIFNLFTMTPYYYKTSAEAVEKLKKVNRLELTCGFSIRTFTKKRGF